MSTLDDVFAAVADLEGAYQDNPDDSGNWSGGRIGVGELRGTKYGVSAAAHPNVDIANLTLDQARNIFQTEYWDKIRGDDLPAPIAFIVADAAYNSGPSNAVHWMQKALGVSADGVIGPNTMAAIKKADLATFATEFLSIRMVFLAGLASWHDFGLGWSRRIMSLPWKATTFGLIPTQPVSQAPDSPVATVTTVTTETVTADDLNQAELVKIQELTNG